MKRIWIILFALLPIMALGQSRKVWLYHGDQYYEKGDYYNALINYKQALSDTSGRDEMIIPYEITVAKQKIKQKEMEIDSARKVPVKDYLSHQIADCFLKTFDYNKAVESFGQTASFESYPDDLYHFAVAQMHVMKYDSAIVNFEKYIKSEHYSDSLLRSAQLLITGCYYALDDQNSKKEVLVTLLDTTVFNKGTSSFAPMYFGTENRLLFTSARKGGVIFDPEKQASEYLCDLYWTERQDNGSWSPATNFGRPLNSAQNDASGYISDKNIVYYTRWSDENPKEKSIYLARMVDFKFYESFKLPANVNVPGYSSINPFVSMDGKTMYFASDRPGGEGGLDLWKIELDENGNVMGEATNLGRPVNSELDEQSPFFHEISATLFFSSRGHNSIGGLDLFKCAFNKENKRFNKPVNLGLPINSSMDDAYIIWDRMMHKGYFASDREPCENGHCYALYEVTNEPIRIALEGYVYDSETEEILADATLTFKDINFEFEPFTLKSDAKGYYRKSLDQNQEIFIKTQKERYFADAANIDTRPITQTTTLQQDFYLRPIPMDEIEIEGIEYDFDKATLRPQSKEILDKLYEFLMLNDNLTVEINSHTDARGSDSYNLDLSKRRAKSCVDYLIAKGVPKQRLIAIGYGETQPNYLRDAYKKPVLNEDGKRILLTESFITIQSSEELKEEYHQRNRRTSFKVVGESVDIQSR